MFAHILFSLPSLHFLLFALQKKFAARADQSASANAGQSQSQTAMFVATSRDKSSKHFISADKPSQDVLARMVAYARSSFNHLVGQIDAAKVPEVAHWLVS